LESEKKKLRFRWCYENRGCRNLNFI